MRKGGLWIGMLLLLVFRVHADNNTADLLEVIPKSPRVGQQVILKYRIRNFSDVIDADLDITYDSSDAVFIEDISVTLEDVDDASSAQLSMDLNLNIEMRFKKSGIITLPIITVYNTRISFPLMYVHSILGESQELFSARIYVPWREMTGLVFSLLLVMFLVYLLYKMGVVYYKKVILITYNIKNILNYSKCMFFSDRIIRQLKRMGKKPNSTKAVLTKNIYSRMKRVLCSRLIFFYPYNTIMSATHEELMYIVKDMVSNSKLSLDVITDFFEVLDEVFYNKKKVSISIRLEHAILFRAIIHDSLSFTYRQDSLFLEREKKPHGDPYVFE